MSMPSITTWIFERDEKLKLLEKFAHIEGTVFYRNFLCLFPDKKMSTSSWDELEKLIGEFDEKALPIPKWIGFLNYEMGDPKAAGCTFYQPKTVIHFDDETNIATLYGEALPSSKLEKIDQTSKKITFRSDSLSSYLEKIEHIKEWIFQGDLYQVNLSQEFHFSGVTDPFVCFKKVTQLNPAPFSAYLQCGDFSIVSSSPELFLSKKADVLETRPIKGTMPRGKTADEDLLNRNALVLSGKDRAELLMITDLMRNDLGKISLPGSVKTEAIWRLEQYTNVFHLHSIIKSKTAVKSAVKIIESTFPAGSITGCPKLRAMDAIQKLEKRDRGIYTGSIGYFAQNGDFDFNVAIRTMVIRENHVQVQLGGAIVIDSDPVQEFEETLHKGESLFTILEAHDCLL